MLTLSRRANHYCMWLKIWTYHYYACSTEGRFSSSYEAKVLELQEHKYFLVTDSRVWTMNTLLYLSSKRQLWSDVYLGWKVNSYVSSVLLDNWRCYLFSEYFISIFKAYVSEFYKHRKDLFASFSYVRPQDIIRWWRLCGKLDNWSECCNYDSAFSGF